MIFLIQTIKDKIVNDFCFFLEQAVEYQNWFRNSSDFTILYSDTPDVKGCVPIGSVEFVSAYLQTFYNKTPLPRNVPVELFPFANRHITNGTHADVVPGTFAKSNDKIKAFAEFVDTDTVIPEGSYQVSEVVSILTEYRCFVFRGKLVGVKHYSGDFYIFPDFHAVGQMIAAYTTAPVAYTLDVAVNETGTFVIEVHDFFSCGLYGFADAAVLPFMFTNWFHDYIKS